MMVRVFKRGRLWHWWCRDCMGGDWSESDTRSRAAAFHHALLVH